MLKKIKATCDFISKRVDVKPEAGIILGTGLGGLVGEIDIVNTVKYKDIPDFPVSTVKGHEGQFIFGKLGNKNVVVMQGRFHYYEGYTMQEVAFPVRVMKLLGINKLILSNAAGGMNPCFEAGDIMFINDHINLMPANPLIGRNIDELGPRFPDMSEPYNKNILKKAAEIAERHKIKYHTGIYAAVAGPCYETPAEYRYIRSCGADAVGMSTVPEVIAARHMNIDCFAVSVITDLGVEGKIKKITHEEVIEAAEKAEHKITVIIRELLTYF